MNSCISPSALVASYASTISALLRAAAPVIAEAQPVQAPAQGAGIILTPPSPPNASAVRMELHLNTPGSTTPQTTAALPAGLRGPQVIEAQVLRNTLLAPAPVPASTAAPAAAATPAAAQAAALPRLLLPTTSSPGTGSAPQPLPAPQSPQSPATGSASGPVKVELVWQGRLLQLASPQPLPVGSRVRIDVSAGGELRLLPPPPQPVATSTADARPALPPVLQQALRHNLPRQQPLADALPLLRQLAAPGRLQQLPAPLARAITTLLQSLPTPPQLQSADGLRRAIATSGNALEARLPAAAVGRPADAGAALAAIAGDEATPDIKAQVVRLVAMIRLLAPPRPGAVPTPDPELVYSAKPQSRAPTGPMPPTSDDGERDVLQQLGKLLQGGLARIQLNQLESAASRQTTGAEGQPATPSWLLELPINSPRGTENLQLRIDQQRRQQDGQAQMQWTVQMAFDLHQLGKLAVTLTILGNRVAATLWAEQSHTHRVVREELDGFKAALESVGVTVGEVQCRRGLPPAQARLISQQLVDVRT